MKDRGVAALAAFGVTVALLLVTRAAGATVYSFTSADVTALKSRINGNLVAGDEVILGAGTYVLTGFTPLMAPGTSAQPITIHAATGASVVWQAGTDQDAAVVTLTSYLTIDGIEFAASPSNTFPTRGIRITDSSSHITISNCNLHGFENAIAANASATDVFGLTIQHNEMHDLVGTGEGVYLGCVTGACTVHDSVIEQNYIHDTTSNGGSGFGIEIKKGSTATVRDNVVASVAAGCIQVFGGSVDGGVVSSTIERNACIKALGDNGIDIGSDAIVRNNIVVSPHFDGIAAVTSDSITPGNLTIQNNTLIVPNAVGIRLNSVGGNIAVYDNAIYAQSSDAIHATGTTAMVTSLGNYGIGTLTGVSSGFAATGNLTNDFVGVAYDGSTLDAYPKLGSGLIGSADSAHIATDDYNAFVRGTEYDVGAYLYSATGNPGQTIALGFKTLPTPPELDGGVDGGLDGGADAGAVADGGSSDAGKKDGGSSGSDASLGGDSGGASTTRDDAGSSNGDAASSGDDSGCGCHIGPDSDSSGYAFSLVSLGLVALTGARRSRRRRPRA